MRLTAAIVAAEERQKHMRAANRIVNARTESREVRILRLCRECGLPLAQAEALMTPDPSGRTGYTGFQQMQNARDLRRLTRQLKRSVERTT